MAFKGKPITDDLRDSMAIKVFQVLRKKYKKSKFYGYDPIVNVKNIKKIGLQPIASISKSFLKRSLIIILNNHYIFEGEVCYNFEILHCMLYGQNLN